MSEYTIFIDDREKRSKILNYLRKMGVKVLISRLNVGDYIISKDIIIERKKIDDLVNSLIDGRLFEQVKNMLRYSTRPLIIVEGNLNNIYRYRKITPHQMLGLLSTLLLMSVNIIFVRNEEETAYFIYSLIKKINTEKEKKEWISPTKIGHRKGGKSIWDAQVNLISSIPGISREMAIKILKYFGSPRKFFKASSYEMKKVEGIGDKRIKKIIEILDTMFKGLDQKSM